MALTDIENCDGWECPNSQECNDDGTLTSCPLYENTNDDDRTTPLDKLLKQY